MPKEAEAIKASGMPRATAERFTSGVKVVMTHDNSARLVMCQNAFHS